MNRSLVGVGLAAGAVIAVIACAGKSSTVGGAGDSGTSGGSSGTSGGSSSGGLVADCPTSPPSQGTACTQDQQVCQYGDCSDPSMRCENGAWHDQQQGCPVSSREKKRDIRYLGEEDLAALRDRTLSTRLAQYQYTSGDPSNHLGFIIEDDPESPAISRDHGHVDLYSYTSMAVATLQMQSREISELRREVKELRRDLDDARKTRRK